MGTITFGYLVDIACAVPILLVAALLIGIVTIDRQQRRENVFEKIISFDPGGGLLGFLLPNTTNTPLL